MKSLIIIIFAVFAANSQMMAQTNYSLNYIGRIGFPPSLAGCSSTDTSGGSDVWGYTAADSSEYAIMGVKEGVAFVKIPELQVIGVVPGPTNGDCWWHRDIQTYSHYAYIVSEMTGTNQGLMIVDLQYLPDSLHFVKSYSYQSNIRSHNMHIDVNTGFAYILNQNYTGFRVVDLADPENPVDVNNVISPPQPNYTHDVFARNDTVVVSEGAARSFSIWNLADKQNPQILARVNIPGGGYVHNAWLTDDGNYLMTTEETTNRTVKLWDIRNLTNIMLAGEYLAPNLLAHNAHIKGNLAVISHYAYGLVVVDISDPQNPVEVAHYDTYAQNNNPGFRGNWGAFPYSPNGYIYASDINGFLTVLKLETNPTGIEDSHSSLPRDFLLSQNFPNPFNPGTTIQYSLPENGYVNIDIFNNLGQKVRTLVSQKQNTGRNQVYWDGRDDSGKNLPSGNYFYELSVTGKMDFMVTKRMVLIK